MRRMKICVFCSSSDAVDGAYRAAAAELGALIGAGGHTMVYGGGGSDSWEPRRGRRTKTGPG